MPKVAYVMSRFPKLTETFILYEMEAVEELGTNVELYPLLREPEHVVHPEAEPWIARAHYQPFLSWPILQSNLRWLALRPRAYLGALATLARATWGSRNYFLGGLAIFPKVAHAARLMERDGVAHVHCHFANHPAAAGFVVRRLTGIPYSFTAHGSDLHRDRHMLCEKVAEAESVITISEYNRAMILDECGAHHAAKIAVIHAGVDTDVFALRTPRPASNPFDVLCVASFDPVKGQVHLIEACRLLAESGLEVVLRLAGDGPTRAQIEAAVARSGLGERVILLGRQTRAQVAALLEQADAFVLPSVPTPQGDREGIPVVLMEAMARGVPVVASDLSGIPELVEDGASGLLVPAGDARAIAAALRRIHDEPELAERFAAAGRARVEAEFELRANTAAVARRFAS